MRFAGVMTSRKDFAGRPDPYPARAPSENAPRSRYVLVLPSRGPTSPGRGGHLHVVPMDPHPSPGRGMGACSANPVSTRPTSAIGREVTGRVGR